MAEARVFVCPRFFFSPLYHFDRTFKPVNQFSRQVNYPSRKIQDKKPVVFVIHVAERLPKSANQRPLLDSSTVVLSRAV